MKYHFTQGHEPQSHIADTGSDIPVLKTAVLYGPNASGKTKFIQAIDFLAPSFWER